MTLREICHTHTHKRWLLSRSPGLARRQLKRWADSHHCCPFHFRISAPSESANSSARQKNEKRDITAGSLCQRLQSFWTYKMSEISHHRSILTLSHVQGLGHSPQDIKAPIPTHKKSLALASNLDDELLLDIKQKEPNSPFNLGHFPVFQDENVEEINVKTNILAFSRGKLCRDLTCP